LICIISLLLFVYLAASNWLEQDTNQARVVALYDYTARNSDELSFTKGTIIYLAPVGKYEFPWCLISIYEC
jgi:hypothetical protein